MLGSITTEMFHAQRSLAEVKEHLAAAARDAKGDTLALVQDWHAAASALEDAITASEPVHPFEA